MPETSRDSKQAWFFILGFTVFGLAIGLTSFALSNDWPDGRLHVYAARYADEHCYAGTQIGISTYLKSGDDDDCFSGFYGEPFSSFSYSRSKSHMGPNEHLSEYGTCNFEFWNVTGCIGEPQDTIENVSLETNIAFHAADED